MSLPLPRRLAVAPGVSVGKPGDGAPLEITPSRRNVFPESDVVGDKEPVRVPPAAPTPPPLGKHSIHTRAGPEGRV